MFSKTIALIFLSFAEGCLEMPFLHRKCYYDILSWWWSCDISLSLRWIKRTWGERDWVKINEVTSGQEEGKSNRANSKNKANNFRGAVIRLALLPLITYISSQARRRSSLEKGIIFNIWVIHMIFDIQNALKYDREEFNYLSSCFGVWQKW